MTKRLLIAAFALLCVFANPAYAKHHKHHHHHKTIRIAVADSTRCVPDNNGRMVCSGTIQRSGSLPRVAAAYDSGSDPRPSPECAWWLRRYLGIPKTAFPPYGWNLARNFAGIGSPAPRGCTGCVAVFSRGRTKGHVGLVEGWDASGNPIVLSNLGHGTITTQPHPLSRLIALRWVDGRTAMR